MDNDCRVQKEESLCRHCTDERTVRKWENEKNVIDNSRRWKEREGEAAVTRQLQFIVLTQMFQSLHWTRQVLIISNLQGVPFSQILPIC